MTSEYLVTWQIDLDADSPEEAAQQAMNIMRDPLSMALVFDVTDKAANETHRVDLFKEDPGWREDLLNMGYWESHPVYSVKDWSYEVSCGDTRQSYRQWLWAKLEEEEAREAEDE